MSSSANTEDADWCAYYRRSAGRPPRRLAIDAAQMFPETGRSPQSRSAVDLGCGDGTETRHLLECGFSVTAVDREPAALARAEQRASAAHLAGQLRTVAADLTEFEVPAADLVLACASLPFIPPESFAAAWSRIIGAVHGGGLLAVQLFGDRDSWAEGSEAVHGMTFHRRAEVTALLDTLEVLSVSEHEYDGPSGRGPKHWHRFDVIARG